MGELELQPFFGLFNIPAPGVGRDAKWTFFEPNLNDSVRRLLAHLDQVFGVAAERDWVFLTTVENDVEAGRFPEVLRNFLGGEFWSTCARYFVASMGHVKREPESVVGRITFETRPAQLVQVLALNEGFSWGADLSIGGVQVRESDVAEALTLNPFNIADATRLESLARLAWAASRDLDELGLNVSAGHDAILGKLAEMRTA